METTDSAMPLPKPQLVDLTESQLDKLTEKALEEKEEWYDGEVEETDGRGGTTSQALPVEADMILAYATVPGECG